MHKKIDVYDFDGTIYDGDSTVDFFFFTLFRNPRIIVKLPVIFWYACLYLLHIVSLQTFKSHFFSFVTEVKDIDKEYKSHEISIKNEEDRLEIKGRFKRGVEVKAILYKNGIIKEYNIPISKKPYTAMCVDIFTEEENKNGIVVTKYINKEDLSGKYSLYLQINDTIYKTGKYIEE